MKKLISAIFILGYLLKGYSQIFPDVFATDNYRPYMSEAEKTQAILKASKAEYPRTSEQLYPHLYRQVNPNPLGPLKGTSADPSNAFTDYTKQPVVRSTPSGIDPFSGLPKAAYDNRLSVNQRNMAIYEADLAAYKAKQERQRAFVDDVTRERNSIVHIKYTLGTHNGEAIEPFIAAYSTLHNMLLGKEEIDFLKAVYVVESAYDRSLTFDEFSGMLNSAKEIIERLMIQDGLDPNENMSKIMSIFKYMADTTEVYMPEKEKPVVTKPMLYDYEDYGGKKDARKIFVSKLLRTGTGQCMSLPMLYYLFAKELDTKDVHMVLAPEHSFIKFRDYNGDWNNIELTGRMFTSDDFQWQGGFVKSNQVKSGIYLNPLTEKETIAYLLTTLSITYFKSFGMDDRLLDMGLTARTYFPQSLAANSMVAGYFKDLFNNVLRQYRLYNLTQKDLDNDKNAQAINNERIKWIEHVYENLGYEKIPDWHYEQWLEGVNELARREQHIVKRRQLEQQLKK